MDLDQILDTVYSLPQNSKQLLNKHISQVKFSKGHILLRADKVENTMFFISKGMVRAYAGTAENEITFWFGKEGDVIISMKSYVANEKGYEDIELLEDCEFYKLNTLELQEIFKEDIHIANWGRKFAEKELIKTEERLISRQFRTATERYKELMLNSSELLQRVQLGYLASYLGITQVSLSRIRAQVK